MARKYPPYVNAYNSISKLLEAIQTASVPPKFTYDFLNTVLGLKSSSYRAMIPLLKKLEFLDVSSVPTQAYKDYRNEDISKSVLAEKIKIAYSDVFSANEYAYKLGKDDIAKLVTTLTGAEKGDPLASAVAGTIFELFKLAEFEQKGSNKTIKKETPHSATTETQPEQKVFKEVVSSDNVKLGISYTINLNLPATTEIDVFNAIFKSLKNNIIDNQ